MKGRGWLEFEPRTELNPARRAYVVCPLTEGGRAYIGVESIPSRNGEIAVVDEYMLVEGVIKLSAEYDVESLTYSGVLGNRKVHVFVVRPSEPKNARTLPGVAKYPRAGGARPSRLERGRAARP